MYALIMSAAMSKPVDHLARNSVPRLVTANFCREAEISIQSSEQEWYVSHQ